jgi:hypothetical protein
MVNWDPSIDQAYGLLLRATSIGLGTTEGYTMNYLVADGNLQINLVQNEVAVETIAETHVPMTPAGGPYRWVFTAYGDNLLGQVFALPDTTNPIGSVTTIDTVYASGNAGLFVFSNVGAANYTDANAYADATFDNYDASVPTNGAFFATVVALSPIPGEQVTTLSPLVRVAILDRETTVDTNSVQLWVDGVAVPPANFTLTNQIPAGTPAILATPTAKTGAVPGIRQWDFSVRNSSGPAFDVALASITLTQSGGPACTTPTVQTSLFPLSVGSLATAGSSLTVRVPIDFGNCQPTARFTVDVGISANAGTYVTSTRIGNQFP